MPFLRVIRDKRGYETTYLMHWYREGGRQRSRILYVFRTPGGVRVGRTPLEPATLKALEVRYPEIDFDWRAVVEAQQVISPAEEPRRRRPKRDEDEETAAPPALPVRAEPPPPAPPASPPPPPVPAAIEGGTPDEQMAFLGRWYLLIRERIERRASEPSRQEALLALAERLNPASWTDADQIASGLALAAEALERLSHVFAPRRRRARRRPSTASESSQTEPVPSES